MAAPHLPRIAGKIGGHSPEFYNDFDKVLAYVRERGEKILKTDKLGKLQAKLFDLDVEPKLVAPTFIYHYPTEISPLARRNKDNPDITDRFELFIMGREYGNAFSELNDPIDQRMRLNSRSARRRPATTKPARWTKITCARWNTVCPRPRAKASASTGWSCS